MVRTDKNNENLIIMADGWDTFQNLAAKVSQCLFPESVMVMIDSLTTLEKS